MFFTNLSLKRIKVFCGEQILALDNFWVLRGYGWSRFGTIRLLRWIKNTLKGKLKHLKRIIFCKDEYEAIEGADVLVIITEWNQFRRLDFARIKKIMKDNYIFDLRNIYSKEIIEKENGI